MNYRPPTDDSQLTTDDRRPQEGAMANETRASDLEKLAGGLEWRCIGPHRGGRVVAVAGDPAHEATFYFGACAGGVWKSDDGGTFWRNVSDGFFKTAAVG